MLAAANIFFFIFHTALILFNVFGWMHAKTRLANLVTLLATLVSWIGMGLIYGVGYCICTDWHWQVRRSMGILENPDSYLVLLIRNLSGWDPPTALVNNVAAVVYTLSLLGSITLNLRDWMTRKSKAASASGLRSE